MNHLDGTTTWPPILQRQQWPATGVSYCWEDRGYVNPVRLQLWLSHAFGQGKGKFIVCLKSNQPPEKGKKSQR